MYQGALESGTKGQMGTQVTVYLLFLLLFQLKDLLQKKNLLVSISVPQNLKRKLTS